jgi:hypothetical protein
VHNIVRRGQAVYRDHRWSRERERFTDLLAKTLGVDARRP